MWLSDKVPWQMLRLQYAEERRSGCGSEVIRTMEREESLGGWEQVEGIHRGLDADERFIYNYAVPVLCVDTVELMCSSTG